METTREKAMAKNPLKGFRVHTAEIQYIGHDLQRPECILAEPDGSLWVADARGGVVKISPDGRQEIITQTYKRAFQEAVDEADRFTQGTLPNGLAFAENGDLLISNFGTDVLEVMKRDGTTKILYDNIDGQPIGKVNFVLRDSKNRIWLTISTRIKNWMKAMSPQVDDGYIALVDEKGIRIVADGFRFTNEIRFDAKEEYLYIVETTGQCISRMQVAADGSLLGREVFGPRKLGRFGFPDGIAFDELGNLWGTLIMSDQLFVLTPEGDFFIILDDGNEAASIAMEKAFLEDRLTPEIMLAAGGTMAPWFASITFGGPDLRTAYIGSLRGTRIPYFRSPLPGLPMVHWRRN
jgi:gluconolactonase